MDNVLFTQDSAVLLERIAVALETIAKAHKTAPKATPDSKFDCHKNAWSPEEDERLMAGKKLGLTGEQIAKHLPGRTPGACNMRFLTINRQK